MRPGIKITEETVGNGLEATKGKVVVIINLRTLPLDEKDLACVPESWRKLKINLARRDEEAGLRYGVKALSSAEE